VLPVILIYSIAVYYMFLGKARVDCSWTPHGEEGCAMAEHVRRAAGDESIVAQTPD
jgi:hypothetical protein